MSESRITIGIFVGGSGKRMGGLAKGLLRTPDGAESLVERLARVCKEAAPGATVHLVGEAAPYAGLGLGALPDEPAGVGPIGGLRGLLLQARANDSPSALALACDLPFLDEGVVRALCAPLRGAARVPFAQGRDQPLSAAYAPEPTLRAVDRLLSLGQHRLMGILEDLAPNIERVTYDGERGNLLRDWDTPEDMQG